MATALRVWWSTGVFRSDPSLRRVQRAQAAVYG